MPCPDHESFNLLRVNRFVAYSLLYSVDHVTGCQRWRQTLDCGRRYFRTTKLIFLNDANDVQNIICYSGRFSLATEYQNIPTLLALCGIDNAMIVCHVTVYLYSYCLDVTSVDLDNYVAWLFFIFTSGKYNSFFCGFNVCDSTINTWRLQTFHALVYL